MQKLTYFRYCVLDGSVIDGKEWYQMTKHFSPAGVFESLLRHDAGVKYDSDGIWGDKSPSYITALPLLKQHFPEAKFIHIIRDVRDYCLSIHRAWEKNMVRAAQRWNDGVHDARAVGKAFEQDYMELRYEDLLDNPDVELRKICDFIDLEYVSNMSSVTKKVDAIGETKDKIGIVNENKRKYEKVMPVPLRLKIESIAGNTLSSLGYSVGGNPDSKRVSNGLMFLYKMLDGFNMVKVTLKRRGFIETLKYTFGTMIIKNH
jgi:hypothetical protein